MICASSGVSSLYDLRRFDQDRNNFDSALAGFDTRDNRNSLTVARKGFANEAKANRRTGKVSGFSWLAVLIFSPRCQTYKVY